MRCTILDVNGAHRSSIGIRLSVGDRPASMIDDSHLHEARVEPTMESPIGKSPGVLAQPGDSLEAGTSIQVDTRCGNPIQNIQDRTLSPDRVAAANYAAKRDFGAGAKIVNGPSGYYNCAGLVLASRRTQVGLYDLNIVWKILLDDGYVTIHEEADAEIGDIVTYSFGDRCEHIGIVVEAAVSNSLKVPRILSKHGFSVEVVHLAHEGPYKDCKRSYHRMRNYDRLA